MCHQLSLRAPHFCRSGGSFVVKAMQMKKTVHDIQPDFANEGIPKSAGVSARSLGAHKNFPVLESDHIGRSGFAQKTAMQLRHAPVGNENDVYLFELFQRGVSPRDFQAFPQGALREILQHRQPHRHRSLPIADDDLHASGRVSAWKFRVMSRAPLLNVR